MEDKFIMMDVLLTEKDLVDNTAVALNEASCNTIYKEYFGIFKKVSQEAQEIFNLCYNNSWYQLEDAPKAKITKEHEKLCKELGCE